MRLLLGLIILVAAFTILVRVLPASWALPLYIFFVVASAIFVGRERRQIFARRRSLEASLREEHPDLIQLASREEEE